MIESKRERERNSIELWSCLFAFMLYLSSIFFVIKTFFPSFIHCSTMEVGIDDDDCGLMRVLGLVHEWKDFYRFIMVWKAVNRSSMKSSCKINQWERLFISLSSSSNERCYQTIQHKRGMSFTRKSHLFAQILVQHHRRHKKINVDGWNENKLLKQHKH